MLSLLLLSCAKTPPEPAASAAEEQVAVPASEEADEPAASDDLVVPGERVGPVAADVDRAALEEAFGAEAVDEAAVDLGEGFAAEGWRVDAGERSLSVVVEDEGVRVSELGEAWRTAEGIGVGTSLTELEAVLGDFRVAGFGWDYEGTVDLGGTALEGADGLLVLRMRPTGDYAQEDYTAVLGDAFFPSSDPSIVELSLVVDEVIVRLR